MYVWCVSMREVSGVRVVCKKVSGVRVMCKKGGKQILKTYSLVFQYNYYI